MSEIVERVSKIIYPALVYGSEYEEVEFESALSRPRYQHLKAMVDAFARAAIGAMREPTSAMVSAGYDVGYSPDPLPCDDVYRAMIDEALK